MQKLVLKEKQTFLTSQYYLTKEHSRQCIATPKVLTWMLTSVLWMSSNYGSMTLDAALVAGDTLGYYLCNSAQSRASRGSLCSRSMILQVASVPLKPRRQKGKLNSSFHHVDLYFHANTTLINETLTCAAALFGISPFAESAHFAFSDLSINLRPVYAF